MTMVASQMWTFRMGVGDRGEGRGRRALIYHGHAGGWGNVTKIAALFGVGVGVGLNVSSSEIG